MIRENQQVFNILNVMLDIFVLLISILFINSPLFEKHGFNYHFNFETTLVLFILLIPSYLFLYYMFKLYTPQRTNRSIFSESSKIAQANFIEYLFLSVMCTLDILIVPVNFLIIFLVVNLILAIIERAILRGILRVLRTRGFNIKYILIVGAGEVGRKLVDTIHVNTYLGYKVVGFLDDNVIGTVNDIKVMGTVDDIENILSKVMIDRVIVSISPRHYTRLEYIMESCEKMGVRADIVPDYYRYITSNPSIELIDNIPLISVRYLPLDISYNKIIKRIFDILFVIIVSIIISPLLLVTAILIKLTSTGPVIYKQERVGENGKIFFMYKFRSMYSENEYIDDENWTQKNDPRITKVGKIIRKTSIDELPQFYNILKGEMSLIGPRPERPFFVNKFRETVPKYMIKHHVQPGMTGWAQINGYRGNTSIVKRIEHDIYYVENWSISLDIKIFFKTLRTLLTDPNAY
ncbi:undecaprenyl-phosphate glucose phosphotransferase [Methanosphaera sp. WGK6]|uniref:undecaprenyl-phosphate glucose phosphotransferase n=1 Tax=Methanosphaera sp. WGK6 TaxID=1561964 RepID=UPI00084C7C51|nr:undecaprenyl-phosphate glucose phosphotransferase [Methanosphaera sp. WGK6]OED30275.1 UDP-phosphate glucose phosphotransferase [Methanosphaera sp. WGK6]